MATKPLHQSSNAFEFPEGARISRPPGNEGDYSAIGVYNPYVYVNATLGVVIASLSANPRYGALKEDRDDEDYENILALQAVSRQFV